MAKDISVFSRRHLLAGAISAAAAAALPAAARAGGAPEGLDPALLRRAIEALGRHASRVSNRSLIGIADYGLHSSRPRFFLYQPETGRAQAFRVAHGRGSDKAHTGMLQNFSDRPGSAASSEGAYLTGESYSGQHGLSRRLIGMEAENRSAFERAIVVHGAWYCEPALVAQTGKLGRSEGCFAFSAADVSVVLHRLGPGSLLYSSRT